MTFIEQERVRRAMAYMVQARRWMRRESDRALISSAEHELEMLIADHGEPNPELVRNRVTARLKKKAPEGAE